MAKSKNRNKRAQCHAKRMASIATAAAAPPTATATAFRITELFELILLELPMNDLFIIQRVCRDWRDSIKASTAIQRKMFLQARLDKPVVLITDESISQNFQTLIKFGHQSCCNRIPQFSSFLDLQNRARIAPGESATNFAANPVWCHLKKTIQIQGEVAVFQWWRRPIARISLSEMQFRFFRREDVVARQDAWSRKEASWRKMLMMQPPVLIDLEAVFGIDRGGAKADVWRLGDMIDALTLEKTKFDYSELVLGFSRLWD